MLTVELQGGLGNQLFQLAFLEYASSISGKPWYISTLKSPHTVHSTEQYFETIFKNWKQYVGNKYINYIIQEKQNVSYQDWATILKNPTGPIKLCGYFQNFEYVNRIRETFIQRLSFDTSILEKYPTISEKIFIHIRGGDYKNNSFHNVELSNYYKTCIELFDGSDFVIFTNDIEYAKTILPDTPIIEENEVDTLYLMSKCKGGICANSSFSWWGAYLNPLRKIAIPSRWVNGDFHHSSYRVEGWNVI
jgi:hypothetical protein